jgi:outer membrane protein OmpA-like peptidoglycan-associated protein
MTTQHANRTVRMWLTGLCTLPMLACAATQPSVELTNARNEYAKAEKGIAAKLAPADLHEAHATLAKAEAAFQEDAMAPDSRDLAYIAWRRAQLAQAKAEMARAEQVRADAAQRMTALQAQQAAATRERLSQTQKELADQQQQMQNQSQQFRNDRDRMQAERAEADRKAKEAEDKLSKLAEIRHDDRGTVLTLSGSVLFASGKSRLLPSASRKLDQVAQALKETEGKLVIEGYTDSRGSDAKNQVLSLARAQAVRSYLITHGVADDKVAAVGMGESNPIADNKSTEGRANNRRVEIVIQPVSQPAGPGTPTTPGKDDDKGKKSKAGDKSKEPKGTHDKKSGDTKIDSGDDLKD